MNIEDILKGRELTKNDKSGTKLGENGQIEILGQIKESGKIVYVVKCSICENDPELFGDGYFKSIWGRLKLGRFPCGCSKSVKWTKEQLEIKCIRVSEKLGYKFIKLIYNGEKPTTRCKALIICEEHGSFETMLSNYIYKEWGCRKCGEQRTAESSSYSDDYLTNLYVKEKKLYVDGTTFKRLDRLNKHGHKAYIECYCPICKSTGIGTVATMTRGSSFCECILENQKHAYILDIGGKFIKFGIAVDVKSRVKAIKRSSHIDIELIGYWKFPNKFSCRDAESTCKRELECGVIEKELLQEGYTETTYNTNIDFIIKTYEDHGGVRVK